MWMFVEVLNIVVVVISRICIWTSTQWPRFHVYNLIRCECVLTQKGFCLFVVAFLVICLNTPSLSLCVCVSLCLKLSLYFFFVRLPFLCITASSYFSLSPSFSLTSSCLSDVTVCFFFVSVYSFISLMPCFSSFSIFFLRTDDLIYETANNSYTVWN